MSCGIAFVFAMAASLLLSGADLAEALERRALRQILELEVLPHLDLGRAAIDRRVREFLRPLERLVARLDIDDRVAGDELLRLGERPVDHRTLLAIVLYAPALRARLQPGGVDQHAGLG